jgi:hypothetical protein
MEFSIKMKNGKGEFLFAIDEGFSLSMDLDALLEIEMTQRVGEQEMSGKGKGSLQTKNKWKLEERKKE